MSYHKVKLRHDIIHHLQNNKQTTIEELTNEVIKAGFTSKRVYTDEEVISCFNELLKIYKNNIKQEKGVYKWQEPC